MSTSTKGSAYKRMEPKPITCLHCDFGTGHRGMDSCGKCGGTGSQFVVWVSGIPYYYPNTRGGYVDACKKMGVEPEPE